MKQKTVVLFMLFAAAMDAGTGMGLLFFPETVLQLMGLSISVPLVFVRWVGIFVTMTGIWYLLPLAKHKDAHFTELLKLVLLGTAILRALVACFLIWAMSFNHLDMPWWPVPVTDWGFAIAQAVMLLKGVRP